MYLVVNMKGYQLHTFGLYLRSNHKSSSQYEGLSTPHLYLRSNHVSSGQYEGLSTPTDRELNDSVCYGLETQVKQGNIESC